MTDRYEKIRQALEGLREQCARDAERVTGRRRAVAAMINNEAVKPCEVAVAIRKIDVQQYYECAVGEIERDEALLRQALEALKVENARLVEALRRYGVHDEACTAWDIPICTCGLDAALEQENSND